MNTAKNTALRKNNMKDKKARRPLSPEERALLSEPFDRVIVDLERYEQLFYMCKAGIAQLAKTPGLMKALKTWTTEPDHEHEKKLEKAERIAEASQREVSENFPMLYAQAIVTVSNFLDTTLEDFFILWFQHRKDALGHKKIRAVQVRAVDYELLDPIDRMRLIVKELMTKAIEEKHRHGAERFEFMLRLIGIQKGCHRNILVPLKELRAFRNAIVHANQRADKKFCEACPWIVPKDGRLIIDEEFYRRTADAVVLYFASVPNRVREVFFPVSSPSPQAEKKAPGASDTQ
jgi:hypothetical protein